MTKKELKSIQKRLGKVKALIEKIVYSVDDKIGAVMDSLTDIDVMIEESLNEEENEEYDPDDEE